MKMFFFSVPVLLMTWFSICSAAPTSTVVPYYGDEFYQTLQAGISNEDLQTELKKVLRSPHISADGVNDQIVSSCDEKQNPHCYGHVAIGYRAARIFLLGNYYLVNEGGGKYGVRDVYCQREVTSDEFGSVKPGPGLIPADKVVNTEHTWPQSKFSRNYDKEMQKSDLHHLYPTDSKANGIRGNFEFGEVVKDTKTIACPGPRFGTPAEGGQPVFEPPTGHKGEVARALFYFSTNYDMPISAQQEAYLRKWNKEEPVTAAEMDRNEAIFKAQGDRNPFIDYPDLADRIANF